MGRRSLLLPMLDRVASLLPRDRAGADEALVARAASLGDDGFAPALGALLLAYRREAALSPFGRLAARWDIERFLTNLRRLRDEEARSPEIRDEKVAAPLIVTGLPRSGTSFLHGLLAEDPANQAVRCWQTVYPYPEAGREDRRASRVAWQLRAFRLLAPNLRRIHPMDSLSPQECTEITAHAFQSLRFDTTHHVPSYRAWLDARGHAEGYRFHRRFLQHLQHQQGRRRWVLKCPDHVFALDALHGAYPDARIVFVHRDPAKILPSVANLTDVLRAPFTRRTDPMQIGRQVLRDWTLGARLMVAADQDWPFASPPPFHAQYRDIVARPLETLLRLYRHFGMTLDDAARARIARRAAARPDGGYGRNVYNPADYGLDAGAMRHDFRAYVEHFDVMPETRPVPAPAAQGGTRLWANPLRSRQHAGP
jgi:hypothetical protein